VSAGKHRRGRALLAALLLSALLLSALLLSALLAGCGASAPRPAAAPSSTATASPTAPAATLAPPTLAPPTLAPSPTPPPPPARPQIALTAVLDMLTRIVVVQQQLIYPNHSGASLPELILMVEAARYPDGFRLTRLSLEDGSALASTLDGNQLRVTLPQPLADGAALTLRLDYELTLPQPVPNPAVRPVPYGVTPHQTNLVDWYPYVAPYRAGQGWLAHQPGYFGEHTVYDLADFQIDLRVENGAPGLIAAASAPYTGDPVGGMHFEYSAARNFAISLSSEYLVTRATVAEVEVLGYAFPLHAAAGEAALRTTAAALELYTRLFGPYPRSTLSVVEADFLDGMEYDGLYFLSNGFYNLYVGTPAEYLIAIAAHETAHQWWYAQVANDQATEPWLDEALCTYSERLFYENVHPEALAWWWAARVNYYQPRGWVDGSIFDFSSEPEPYRAYRDAVYLNGAVFLEELRKIMGDDAFLGLLRDYATQQNGQIATRADFFALARAATTADLDPLTARFFRVSP
jgi:hypothetical protein